MEEKLSSIRFLFLSGPLMQGKKKSTKIWEEM